MMKPNRVLRLHRHEDIQTISPDLLQRHFPDAVPGDLFEVVVCECVDRGTYEVAERHRIFPHVEVSECVKVEKVQFVRRLCFWVARRMGG